MNIFKFIIVIVSICYYFYNTLSPHKISLLPPHNLFLFVFFPQTHYFPIKLNCSRPKTHCSAIRNSMRWVSLPTALLHTTRPLLHNTATAQHYCNTATAQHKQWPAYQQLIYSYSTCEIEETIMLKPLHYFRIFCVKTIYNIFIYKTSWSHMIIKIVNDQ